VSIVPTPPDPGPAELTALLDELRELRRLQYGDPAPFGRFKAELLALYEPPRRARPSYLRMRQVLGLLEAEGVKSTSDLTPATVAAFVAAREADGMTPNNTHALLAYVRAACNWAVSEGYLRVSPFANRRSWVRRTTPDPPTICPPATIARVLGHAATQVESKARHSQAGPWAVWRARRLLVMASVGAYTGMRKAEILHLRAEDLDFERGLVWVRAREAHRLKVETAAAAVPMPEDLAAVLMGWLPCLEIPADFRPRGGSAAPRFRPRANPSGKTDPGWVIPNAYRTGPWLNGSPGHKPLDQLYQLGRRAGVEGFGFRALRHSFASNAINHWGWSVDQVATVLRHTDTRTARQHYIHAEASALRALGKGVRF